MKRLRGRRAVVACVCIVAVGLASGACRAQELALSFDDGFDPREQPEAATWNAAILDAPAKAGVSSVLFPAGRRIDSPEGLALVRAWNDAGHAIGNHTYTHASLASSRITTAAFEADVERDDALLRDLSRFTRLVRFRYLKEGDTVDKRDGLRDWMDATAIGRPR